MPRLSTPLSIGMENESRQAKQSLLQKKKQNKTAWLAWLLGTTNLEDVTKDKEWIPLSSGDNRHGLTASNLAGLSNYRSHPGGWNSSPLII